MAVIATTRVRELGTLLEPRANAMFCVADPAKLWFVLAGTLDLFLVEVRQDQSTGFRQHILRVEEGAAIFGVNPSHGERTELFANPGTETKVLCLEKADVARMNGAPESRLLVSLMERWIADLCVAATDKIAPKTFLRLEPHKEITFDENPGFAISLDELTWIRPAAGTVRFLGSEEFLPLDSHSFFPVPRGAWLQCSAHSQIECSDSQTIFEQDQSWSGLQCFSEISLQYLRQRLKQAEERECERIRTMTESDARSMQNALLALAAPLQQPDREGVDSGAAVGDPLLRACQAVGCAAGIEIKPSPGAMRRPKHRDPVSAIARASGVRVRMVLLRGAWWKEDNGPLLAFLGDQNHPVALLPRSTAQYELLDPLTQRMAKVTEETTKDLKEVAYVFYRSFPIRQIKVRDLIAFALHGGVKDVVTIVLMGIAIGLMAMLTPIFTGIIFDDIIPGSQRHALTELTLFLVASAFATTFFSLTRRFAVLRLEGKMDASTQAAVWDRTIALPVPFFRNYTSGDLALRGLAIGQIRQILTGTTLSSILSGIFSIFSFVLLFYYSCRLAIIATALIASAVLVSSLCGYFQIAYQRELSQQQGRISGMMLQFIHGMAKFRVSGTESRVFASWAAEFTKQKIVYFRVRRLSNALSVFESAFPVLAYGGIFYGAAYLMAAPSGSAMTTGEFLAFFVAFTQFLTAALALSDSAVSTLSVIPLIERAKPILDTLPEVDAAKSDPGELSGRIEMNHIFFRYGPDMPLVSKDVSFSVFPGQFIAFVGASGSGKSTIFRLLLGFEKPESGAIYFDGQDLSGLDMQAVRRQLGVVLQNGRVLTGDIFTNIVGSAPLTFDDAWEAARLSGFDRDIDQMPMGMHTIVSEGGGGLSGGQRQRLMIARAIVGKPRILLFDEATSALDNQTQAIVSKSLENLNATRIVIAHRLSTVINADRIFVMEKGQIVQSGSYAELMKEEGAFTELAKRQLT